MSVITDIPIILFGRNYWVSVTLDRVHRDPVWSRWIQLGCFINMVRALSTRLFIEL